MTSDEYNALPLEIRNRLLLYDSAAKCEVCGWLSVDAELTFVSDGRTITHKTVDGATHPVTIVRN